MPPRLAQALERRRQLAESQGVVDPYTNQNPLIRRDHFTWGEPSESLRARGHFEVEIEPRYDIFQSQRTPSLSIAGLLAATVFHDDPHQFLGRFAFFRTRFEHLGLEAGLTNQQPSTLQWRGTVKHTTATTPIDSGVQLGLSFFATQGMELQRRDLFLSSGRRSFGVIAHENQSGLFYQYQHQTLYPNFSYRTSDKHRVGLLAPLPTSPRARLWPDVEMFVTDKRLWEDDKLLFYVESNALRGMEDVRGHKTLLGAAIEKRFDTETFNPYKIQASIGLAYHRASDHEEGGNKRRTKAFHPEISLGFERDFALHHDAIVRFNANLVSDFFPVTDRARLRLRPRTLVGIGVQFIFG